MAKGKTSLRSIAVWVVIGLLVVGLTGFGAAGLSGTARSVGTVNGKQIAVQQYFNAVSNTIRQAEQQVGRALTFPEAQAFGLDRQALSELIAQRSLDAEASRLGLSAGDSRIRETVLSIPNFRGIDGQFDREAYRETLARSDTSEADFEQALREDEARNLLQTAVLTGITAPATYGEKVIGFLAETRDFSWARLGQGDLLTGTPVPTEADLIAYHTANPAPFTVPQTRSISYALLTPDMLEAEVEVSEDTLRAAYDERAAEFNTPERRLVERLVFGTLEEAQAAADAIADGSLTFEDAVTARGLTLADVDMGDVLAENLGDAAEAVFGLTDTGVVGPLTTNLGPAVFRVIGILSAQSTPFEQARVQLADELSLDGARRIIDQQIETLNDLLAGGATLEDMAAETDMVFGQIAYHNGVTDGPAAYDAFQQAAARVTAEDFPQIAGLADGGVFALRLDGIDAPRLLPLADVADAVEAAWSREQVITALMAEADRAAEEIRAGADFAATGLTATVETDMARTSFVEDITPALIAKVFEIEPGEVAVVRDIDGAIVVQVDAISPADLASEENVALATIIGQQMDQSLAQDVLGAYISAVQADADIQLNQQTISAVHANFQ